MEQEKYYEYRVYDMFGNRQKNILVADGEDAWEVALKEAEKNGFTVGDIEEIY